MGKPIKLGLDIGGTGVQYKIIKGNQILVESSFSTRNANKELVIDEIVKLVKENHVEKIGMGAPGAVNALTGVINGGTGIKDWGGGFNVYDEINTKLDRPIEIVAQNDANVALLGAISKEDKKPFSAVGITIGTGVGGAFYINGSMNYGFNGFGGEIGYMRDDETKKMYSNVISSRMLYSLSKGRHDEAKDVLESSNENDIKIVDDWFNKLATFIINMTFTFDPEKIFILGGVTKYHNFFNILNKKINEQCKKFGYPLLVLASKPKGEDLAVDGALELING